MKRLNLVLSLLLAVLLCLSLVPIAHTAEDIRKKFNHEPTIQQVQEAAIRYAEVHPEKIAIWRKKAKIKGLFPEVSVDYDKTINYDSGADRYYTGPYDWGINFKWDLADIIWDYSQTSIDVRSRLMVKLRNDILEKVNEAYFERRRLQAELLQNASLGSDKSLKKQLRIEELTADIDGLTGGYFSQGLK